MNKKYILKFLAAVVVSSSLLHSAEEDPAAKFREALKNSMLKLREVQGQLATAQAAQAAAELKVTELTSKNESLVKDLASERNTSTNTISELNKKISERDETILGLESTVAKWKKSYGEVVNLAAKRENQRATLEAKCNGLENKVADQQMKNIAMYKAGMEILDRYKKFGFGDALLAREPFTAAQRVKFQNLTQDFADDLTDARIPATPAKKK